MPVKKISLPDFVIIGANKAGTTSVAHYLNQHPRIQISRVKEPMFFSSDADNISTREGATLDKPFFAITLDEYSSMFEPRKLGAKLLGEASTAYLANPKQSAQLLKKIVPEVKIIAILREPVGRAISAYKMCVGGNIEQRSFAEIVANAENEREILPSHGVKEYIRNGLYAQLLAPYYKYFSPEQILLLDYEQLKWEPKTFMYAIYEFLQIKPIENNFEKKYNTESDHLSAALTIDKGYIEKLKEFYKEENLKLKSLGDEDSRDEILKHIRKLTGDGGYGQTAEGGSQAEASRQEKPDNSAQKKLDLTKQDSIANRCIQHLLRQWARLQRKLK